MTDDPRVSDAVAAPRDPATYAHPTRNCDIVMKGGITSGVVYPLAVCEIARAYHFKSVGGTSAGAIAAAFTAAAEYGRQTGGAGFAEVAKIPDWLKQDANLLNLFQPQPKTTALFRVAIAFTGEKVGRRLRVARTALAAFPLPTLIGAIPAIVLAAAAVAAGGWFIAVGLVAAFLLLAAGVAVTVGWTAYRQATREVPKNCYGLCTGNGPLDAVDRLALTPWMHRTINRLAGLDETGDPLTFGDLWGHRNPDRDDRNINLQVLTASLTTSRGHRIPFLEEKYFFDPTEFGQLFPKPVVDWMIAHPRRMDEPDRFAPLRPLPNAADLPVVVAARLSLSFPFIVSAIPLWAFNDGRRGPDRGERRPERLWFSDGGMISNFPVHFFDRPLPRWPTFSINLRDFPPGIARSDDEEQNVFLPTSNRSGIVETWTPFEGLFGFVGAIKRTMQNWLDEAQSSQPGYRDRIAHINFAPDEGGLNFTMPRSTLDALSERGRWAGVKLRERFSRTAPTTDDQLTWENHRWIRFRTAMASLETLLDHFKRGYDGTQLGDEAISYDALLQRARAEAPSYAWEHDDQRASAIEATETLVKTAATWAQRPRTRRLIVGAPRPESEWRAGPKV